MDVKKIEVLANPHEFGVVGCVTRHFLYVKSMAQSALLKSVALSVTTNLG